MTGDEGEFWNDVRDDRRERRRKLGVRCPQCVAKHPKREPSILLPAQRCGYRDCGYRDPRPRQT